MKFFRNMYQKSKEQKGFTLVEMIVVLVIIAILAAITIPALLKYIDKAKDKQLIVNARTAYLAAETAASEAYAANIAKPAEFTFNKDSKIVDTNAISKVEENAKNLTGLNSDYTCTVKVGDNWKITSVSFTENGKKAELTVGPNSDWTVSPVTK